MTVIACKVQKGFIEIASDTQVTWGGNKYPIQTSSDSQLKASGKIFQTNGMTIGCAGSLPDIGLLQIFCKTHKPKEMDKDSILDWFMEFREWASSKAKIGFNDISIHGIIICNNKAFTFFDFLDACEVKNFASVGSGMFLAIGAMDMGASVKEAVNIAIKHDLYCGGKIDYLKIPSIGS